MVVAVATSVAIDASAEANRRSSVSRSTPNRATHRL